MACSKGMVVLTPVIMYSLRAMLNHADRYGLKFIIVRDPYYDPLLYFAGWRQVDSLDDKTITIWSKDGVANLMVKLGFFLMVAVNVICMTWGVK